MVHAGGSNGDILRVSMKIGVISDTHNKTQAVGQAFSLFKQHGVAHVLHCGDWTKPAAVQYLAETAQAFGIPVTGVLGNNDLEVGEFLRYASTRQELELHQGVFRGTFDGRNVIMYHGHHKPTLRSVLAEPYDVLLLGHSHKPRYDRLDQKIILNPGSTAFAIPRSKAWQASVAIYDSQAHEAEFIYFAPNVTA